MELRTLYYFLTIAREENITRAAEVLHITQPTLSQQMMQLEEEIGKPLMIRGKRKIKLTNAGMLLYRRADEILNLVDKTEKELFNEDENMNGKLFIGAAECSATYIFLPCIIQSFSQKYPQVTYDFYTGNADLIKERIDQGIIDIGILLEPVDIEKYDFIRLPQKERWGIIVHKNNLLSQKEYIVSQDLMNIPLLNTNRSIVQNEIASWFHEDYEKLHFLATYNLLSNAISLVKQDLGSVISIEGAFYHYSQDEVTFVPFYPTLKTGCVLVWKKHQVLSPIVEQFLKQVYNALED